MSDPDPPTVDAALAGWRLVETTVETVFELPVGRVEGHTAVYEDATLGDAAAAAGLGEGPWRFFFATRLVFDPPLPPLVGPASVYPTVASESARTFERDLRERGFAAVERGRRERTRTDGGDRLRLRQFTARYRHGGVEGDMDVEGWLGVWTHDGQFRLAGGAYPTDGLPDEVTGAVDPGSFRGELLDLIRVVE